VQTGVHESGGQLPGFYTQAGVPHLLLRRETIGFLSPWLILKEVLAKSHQKIAQLKRALVKEWDQIPQ